MVMNHKILQLNNDSMIQNISNVTITESQALFKLIDIRIKPYL